MPQDESKKISDSDDRLEGLLNRINSLAAGDNPPDVAAMAPPASPAQPPRAATPARPPSVEKPVASKRPTGQSSPPAPAVAAAPTSTAKTESDRDCPFRPVEPSSFLEAVLNDTEVEHLIAKFLFTRGESTGRQISEQIKLPFGLVEQLLRQMKHEQTVAYKDAS